MIPKIDYRGLVKIINTVKVRIFGSGVSRDNFLELSLFSNDYLIRVIFLVR